MLKKLPVKNYRLKMRLVRDQPKQLRLLNLMKKTFLVLSIT